MDVAYINPFISSTIDTYKQMLNDDVAPQKPFIKKEPFPTYDISATIGLSGKAQGVIAMAFDMPTALKTVEGMIGVKVSERSADLTDAIGEIVNIVAGYAKKDLTQFNLEISLPNVIKGEKHFITTPSKTSCLIVPFTSKYGNFAMEVALITP